MRRTVVLSVMVVAAMSACGSGTELATSTVSTLDLVAAAPAAAAAQRTAHINGVMTVSTPDGDVTVAIAGGTDFEAGAMDLTLDMSDMPGIGSVGKIEMRLVDGTMYMNMGALSGGKGLVPGLGSRPWVAMDLKQFGVSQSQLTSQNPADMLQGLRGSNKVTDLGTATIDGATTHHYRANVDLAKAMAKLSSKVRDRAKASLKDFGATFPMDVWIGEDGLPRRMRVRLDAAGVGVDERIDFTKYGEPVDVQAPPSDQTTNMDDLKSLSAD